MTTRAPRATRCRCCRRRAAGRRGTEPADALCARCRSGPTHCPHGIDHGPHKYTSTGGTVWR
jgi:hypothetical protein